jgi:WD40 repeat protein
MTYIQQKSMIVTADTAAIRNFPCVGEDPFSPRKAHINDGWAAHRVEKNRSVRSKLDKYLLLLFIGASLLSYSPAGATTRGKVSPIMSAESKNNLDNSHSTHAINLFSVFKAAFSPDGKYIAFLGSDIKDRSLLKICVYDAKNWKLIKTLPVGRGGLSIYDGGLSFSRDGKYLAFGTSKIFLWKIQDWALLLTINGPFEKGDYAAGKVQDLAFDPSGHELSVLYDEVFWPPINDVMTRAKSNELQDAARSSLQAKIEPTITREPVLMAFDIASGRRLFSSQVSDGSAKHGNVRTTNKIIYNADGSQIMTSGLEYNPRFTSDSFEFHTFIAFIDSKSGNFLRSIRNIHSDIPTDFEYSSAANYLATGTSTGRDISKYNYKTGAMNNIGNIDGIKLWDSETGRELGQLGPLNGPVKFLHFSPNGQVLVSCQIDAKSGKVVTVWNTRTMKLIRSLELSDRNNGANILACALSPDGKTLVVPLSVSMNASDSSGDVAYVLNVE